MFVQSRTFLRAFEKIAASRNGAAGSRGTARCRQTGAPESRSRARPRRQIRERRGGGAARSRRQGRGGQCRRDPADHRAVESVEADPRTRYQANVRRAVDSTEVELFYEQLAGKRGDTPELRAAIETVLEGLQKEATSTRRPGIILGRVQSGKTQAFLGVIARSFDRGYDVAVILTKGTKSLAEQTLSRVKDAFRDFIASDQVEVLDILHVPDLTPYELNRKLIFVVKKEDDNLRHLLSLFREKRPELRNKSVLIIDDEADLASVSFRKLNGQSTAGVISQQIDQFRESVTDSAFLQVTATPYALYLQPDDEV